jgi:hypothetical protein
LSLEITVSGGLLHVAAMSFASLIGQLIDRDRLEV